MGIMSGTKVFTQAAKEAVRKHLADQPSEASDDPSPSSSSITARSTNPADMSPSLEEDDYSMVNLHIPHRFRH